MALSLNKPKLDNFASDVRKSAERLRGKFKSCEHRSVTLLRITDADVAQARQGGAASTSPDR